MNFKTVRKISKKGEGSQEVPSQLCPHPVHGQWTSVTDSDSSEGATLQHSMQAGSVPSSEVLRNLLFV